MRQADARDFLCRRGLVGGQPRDLRRREGRDHGFFHLGRQSLCLDRGLRVAPELGRAEDAAGRVEEHRTVLLPRDADGGDRFPRIFVELAHGLLAGGEALGEPGGRVLLGAALDGGREEAVRARGCVFFERGFVEVGSENEKSRAPLSNSIANSNASRFSLPPPPPPPLFELTSGHHLFRFQVEHHGLGALGAHVEADGEAGHGDGVLSEQRGRKIEGSNEFFFFLLSKMDKAQNFFHPRLGLEAAIELISFLFGVFPFFLPFFLWLKAPQCRYAACLFRARASAWDYNQAPSARIRGASRAERGRREIQKRVLFFFLSA